MVTHYNDILAEINNHIEGKVYQRVEKGRLEMLRQIQPFFFVGQRFDIHFLKDDRI